MKGNVSPSPESPKVQYAYTVLLYSSYSTCNNVPGSVPRRTSIVNILSKIGVKVFLYSLTFTNLLNIHIHKILPPQKGRGDVVNQEAKYVESWPNTTSAWAGWSRFDIPVDRYGGVHSQLICTSSTLRSPTCH